MLLQVDAVTVRYGTREALRRFSLAVSQGEYIAVVGPNGSGKSTLVKAMTGLVKPAVGVVRFLGRGVTHMNPKERARQMAVVSQDTTMAFNFTVAQTVGMGRLPYLMPLTAESNQDRRAVTEALAVTDTAHLAERGVMSLSGGERQRVMVARALAQQPSVLLLDEPTAHLDIAHQVELLNLTRRLNRDAGLTVVAVLHDLNLAAQYAGRVVLVKDGALFAEGSPEVVLTEANIQGVYGSRVQIVPHPENGTPHVILMSGAGVERAG